MVAKKKTYNGVDYPLVTPKIDRKMFTQSNVKLQDKKLSPSWLPVRKVVNYQGKAVTLYSIGWLATAANKHPHTLRRWEWVGMLPAPLFSTASSDLRLYTATEIEGYSANIRAATVGRRLDVKMLRDLNVKFRLSLESALKHGERKLDSELSNADAIINFMVQKRNAHKDTVFQNYKRGVNNEAIKEQKERIENAGNPTPTRRSDRPRKPLAETEPRLEQRRKRLRRKRKASEQ